jgi:hypothetical protein
MPSVIDQPPAAGGAMTKMAQALYRDHHAGVMTMIPWK